MKGTIIFIYDATGNKLQKIVDEIGHPLKTTLYMDGIVFENDQLQYITHEEGRARINTGATEIVYDYMIKDHLGNVRMVLTDEQKSDMYPAATMELGSQAMEESIYSNLPQTREDKPSGYGYDPYLDPHQKVSRVRGDGNKIGPSITLRVMAGDKFNLRVSSWYRTNGTNPGTPINPLIDLVNALAGGLGNITSNHGGNTTQEISNSGVLAPGATNFLNSRSYNSNKPKSYINWVILDDQFKYYDGGFEQVGDDNSSNVKEHVFNNVVIGKSGYLYIYVSNETPNIDVFFDNLQVTHIRGSLLEENHYYPFGLIQQGVSSMAVNFAKDNICRFNSYDRQSKEFSDGGGLDWYDYKNRFYDNQVGRFFCQDGIADNYQFYSPYQFAGNEVPNAIDLDGLEPARNPWRWDVFQEGSTYRAFHKLDNGSSVIATAVQKRVRDNNGFTGWITHFYWYETYHGLTQRANDYSWFNTDPSIDLPSNDEGRWQPLLIPHIRRQRQIFSLVDNTGLAVFGLAAFGTAVPAAVFAAPALANGGRFVWSGIQSEASLVKFIPKHIINKMKFFTANFGIQLAFNGREADIFDAVVTSYNPAVALFASPVINVKPFSTRPFESDNPHTMARNFLVSSPFYLFGSSMQILNTNSPTTEYLINTAEVATQKALDPPKKGF